MQKTTVNVPQEILDRLDRLADKVNLTRSEMMRNALEIALDDIESMERLGLLKAATSLRDFSKWLKSGKQYKVTGEHTS